MSWSSSPSSWSWASVPCVVCPTVLGLTVVVVSMGVLGRSGCSSLLLTKSLSTESHFQLSCAVASQTVSVHFMDVVIAL